MPSRRRNKVKRVISLIRKAVAFFISNVGLFAIVIGYCMLGAVTFRAIESSHEQEIQAVIQTARRKAVSSMWNTTFHCNVLDEPQWKLAVKKQVRLFKDAMVANVRRGYDGKELGISAQWTFTGAFLFSLTVVTTIGYGNTSCKTNFGKAMTIMYAIVGIPLMLLFLTNIGEVLAQLFRFLYCKALRLHRQLAGWQRKRHQMRQRRFNGDQFSVSSKRSKNSAQAQEHQRAISVRQNASKESFLMGDDDQLVIREEVRQVSEQTEVTVPLFVVLITMFIYLLIGSAIFCIWEKWDFLGAFYFCYISLTTVGFGDLFPGASVKDDAEAQEKLVICSLYLLLGMALIAMCFNLAQEEVVNKVTTIANKIGMLKQDDDDEEFT